MGTAERPQCDWRVSVFCGEEALAGALPNSAEGGGCLRESRGDISKARVDKEAHGEGGRQGRVLSFQISPGG